MSRSAVGSIANIDQHKIIIPMVHTFVSLPREKNSTFIPWPRDAFFEGQ